MRDSAGNEVSGISRLPLWRIDWLHPGLSLQLDRGVAPDATKRSGVAAVHCDGSIHSEISKTDSFRNEADD